MAYKVGNKWCVRNPSGQESCFIDKDAAEYYEQGFSAPAGGGGSGGAYVSGGGGGGSSGSIVDSVSNIFKSLWGAVSSIAGGAKPATAITPAKDNTTLYLVGGAILAYILLKR